jgi:hypothetical protein
MRCPEIIRRESLNPKVQVDVETRVALDTLFDTLAVENASANRSQTAQNLAGARRERSVRRHRQGCRPAVLKWSQQGPLRSPATMSVRREFGAWAQQAESSTVGRRRPTPLPSVVPSPLAKLAESPPLGSTPPGSDLRLSWQLPAYGDGCPCLWNITPATERKADVVGEGRLPRGRLLAHAQRPAPSP